MQEIVNALIDGGVQVVVALVVALIGVAGTWVTAQIGKVKQLQTVQLAVNEAKDAAMTTALELQQRVVDDLKTAAADGKLTKEEIEGLREKLIALSLDKLSDTSVKILNAAGVDISAVISGAGEAMIAQLKASWKSAQK